MERSPLSRCVFASDNPGKITEVASILDELGIEVVPQSEFGIRSAEETGSTFVENALIKANHAARVSGLPAIADDSGLEVDALDGRPGVHSARFAGDGASDAENVDKLLRELEGIEDDGRTARFHCAVVLVKPGQPEQALVAEGSWQGRILVSRRGEGGFGYDPVFLDPACGQSAAEMPADEKNARSHRGRALEKLAALMRAGSGQ